MVVIISLMTLAAMVYDHGFHHREDSHEWVSRIIRTFYWLVVVNYLLRIFFTLDRKTFLLQNPLESILIGFVIYNGISHYLLGVPLLQRFFYLLGIPSVQGLYSFVLQLFLLMMVGINYMKELRNLGRIHIKPSTLFIGSFLILVAIGTGILMLPTMTTDGLGLPFIDAFFTATSASCVTGLIVVDTATHFTLKGQLILLFLMQIGGIGILSFASFFATFIKRSVGVSYQSILQSITDAEHPLGAVNLLRPIIFLTFGIEMVVALGLFLLWADVPFDSLAQKIFYSVFHAVSAFCNAGFSLFSNGLYEQGVRHLYILHLLIAIAIFFGGLGFPAIRDIFFVENIRKRMVQPWRKWKLSTRIAFYTSLTLIALGSLAFYLLEKDRVLYGMNLVEAVITSIFQSVTTRTAGFNTVDIGALSTPTLFIFMFLMFIGASSGSTGGGIKTSTFVIIFVALLGTVRGRRTYTIGRRNIQKEVLLKAFSIFIFGATYIFFSILLLLIFEPGLGITEAIFEAISAFGTVGLSMGITSELGWAAKLVLILSMFFGRIGLLTMAVSLSAPAKYEHKYQYPDTHLMVG